MNPHTRRADVNDMRPEYDFSGGRRGVHHQAYRAGTNVVFLEPDLVEAFPDSDSVNRALRLLVRLSRSTAVTGGQTRKAASRSRKTQKPKRRAAGGGR
jgi:hypothetical protein